MRYVILALLFAIGCASSPKCPIDCSKDFLFPFGQIGTVYDFDGSGVVTTADFATYKRICAG